jgi:hypothetical protein
VSRDARTISPLVTAIQIEPTCSIAADRATDYVWLRPYIGSGAALRRPPRAPDTGWRSVSANGGVRRSAVAKYLPAPAIRSQRGSQLSLVPPVDGFDAGRLGGCCWNVGICE